MTESLRCCFCIGEREKENGDAPKPVENGKKNVDAPNPIEKGVDSSKPSRESKLAPSNQSGTIRILMVHGAVQNAEIFMKRTSNLRSKALKVPGRKVELVWAESPLQVHPALTSDEHLETDGRAWYTPHELSQGNTVRPVESNKYDDWEQPMEVLRTLAKEQGPFTGLIAFSQGGVPASLLLTEMKDSLQFAIFVSCFGPKDADVCALMAEAKQELINVPTMHVLGKTDPFVKNHRSRELAEYFKDPEVVTHDGGHIMIPKELFGNVKDFLARVTKQ